MKRFTCLPVLLLLAACGASRPPVERVAYAHRIADERPEEALRVLQRVDRQQLRRAAHKAAYALELTRALDRNGIDVQSDSLLAPAAAWIARHGNPWQRAAAAFYIGRIRWNCGEDTAALGLWLEADRRARRLPEPRLSGLVAVNLGYAFAHSGRLPEAIAWYRESVRYFRAASDPRAAVQAGTALVRTLFRAGREREATRTATFVEGWAGVVGDTVSALCLSAARAALQLQAGDPRGAAQILRIGYGRYRNGVPLSADAPLRAMIALRTGAIDSARRIALRFEASLPSAAVRQRAGAWALLATIERRAGDSARVLRYVDAYRAITDSLGNAGGPGRLQRIAERYAERSDRMKLKTSLRERGYALGLLLCVVVAGTVVVGISNRRLQGRLVRATDALVRLRSERRRTEQLLNRMEHEAARLRTRIDGCNERIGQMVGSVDRELHLLGGLVELSDRCEGKPVLFYEKLTKWLFDDEQRLLGVVTDLVNLRSGGFIDRLQARYDCLSRGDLYLCALLCTGLPSSSIWKLMNLSEKSYYNKRMRLRKKLRLQDEKLNLEQCLRQMMMETDAEA